MTTTTTTTTTLDAAAAADGVAVIAHTDENADGLLDLDHEDVQLLLLLTAAMLGITSMLHASPADPGKG